MKKQLLLILMTLLPMVAWADESGTCGDNLTWTYYESTHSLVITGSGDMYDYDANYNSYYAAPWYKYRNDIESVILLKGITSIGEDAFYGCSGLTSVTIPNNVTSIGDEAFYNCSSLTSVTIPNRVTSIGYRAFRECKSLNAVHITDLEAWLNISFSGDYSNPLFYAHRLYLNGEEVKDLVIPNSVTSIGNYVFDSCSSLTSVTMPNSVTSIGNCAFRDCVNMTTVDIPNSVTSIGTGAFCVCSSLTSVTIPNLVTSIGSSTFSGCGSLTAITIPNSVKFIGEWAFAYCNGLTSVIIPNSVKSIGVNAFMYCRNLTTMTIPNSVTYIGEGAFRYCSSLTSVTIPNSVMAIGNETFYGCSSLTSVEIPNSVTSIGNHAFRGCSNISSVYISDLSAWCRINYGSNTEPLIPSNHHLYLNGIEVEQLIIPEDITSLENTIFYGCSYITSIIIPNSVTSIGDYAFANCSSLASISLSENLMLIKKQAFYGCTKLQKLDIPASVEYIFQEAFNGCNSLSEIIARPETPPFIYNDTFSNYDCTLKVPEAGKDAYKTHEIWGQFKPIQTIDDTGVNQVPAQTVLIQSEGGLLTVQGLDDGTEVSVYGVNGTEAGAAVSRNGQALVNTNLSAGSIAIVKIGERSVKVVIK